MARLNIQLSRHGHTTTRRPRWVVWILGIFLVTSAVLTLTNLWFSRPELFIAAPTDTELAIEFNAFPRYIDSIQSLIGSTTLVSNRSLTLEDILPAVRGKFALFVLKDGSTALAIKTNKESLPMELFDAHRIVVQTVSPSVVLLSEKLLPLSPMKTRSGWFRWMPDFFGTRIGSVTTASQMQSEPLTYNGATLSTTLPNLHFTQLKRPLPSETIAYLSTQVLPIDSVTQLLDQTMNTDLLKTAFSHQAWVILTKHADISGVLIWSDQPSTVNREHLMKQLSANFNPVIQEKILEDRTIVREIIINPDLGSIEEVTLQGKIFLHSKSEKGEELYLSKDGELLFSNNEQDVRSFLEGSGDKPQTFCGSTLLGSTTSAMLLDEQQVLNHQQSSVVRELLGKFSFIGAKAHRNSVTFTFCR